MFKQLTNVRPQGDGKPEMTTTTTSGTIRLNAAGAEHMKVQNGDYISILQDTDEKSPWKGLWAVRGNEGDDKNAQFGSKLATASGKNTAGSLGFSSENAYNVLEGNEKTKRVFAIGEGQKHPDFATELFKLTFVREDEKVERKKRSTAKA